MTDKPRTSITLTPELEAQILELRKTDQFLRSSISEIIRFLISKGIEATK